MGQVIWEQEYKRLKNKIDSLIEELKKDLKDINKAIEKDKLLDKKNKKIYKEYRLTYLLEREAMINMFIRKLKQEVQEG